ncbi:MAG TPA: metallophosphoesterase [Thermoanaerobaculia bacterium]|nr:metallophosphoesterase [Thermoanaerobaculia bacterium]
MPELSTAAAAHASTRAAALHASVTADPAKTAHGERLGDYLQACEALLIATMNGQEAVAADHAEIEFGLILYWLDTDFDGTRWGLPPTQITTAQYNQWKAEIAGAGIVAWDGTLIGEGMWETFDPGWAIAGMDYLFVEHGLLKRPTFPTSPVTVQAKANATIAIIGDWGTGSWHDGSSSGPALQVLAEAQKLNADYVIHLGDVYYVGTEGSFVSPHWEADRFVKLWPFKGNSFALNSNHEMYDAANGFFKTALGSNIFSAQGGTSYFAIAGPGWAVIGLDSGYADTSSMFMAGAINSEQQGFLAKFRDVPFVVLMSHHNPISTDGTTSSISPLLGQVTAANALGRTPEMWYWGHIHNGIVYSSSSAIAPTLGRCAGHGAIPFGDGKFLGTQKTITFYANAPMENPDPKQANRVRNGFATLAFNNGSVVETFYDQYGNAPWTNTVALPTAT